MFLLLSLAFKQNYSIYAVYATKMRCTFSKGKPNENQNSKEIPTKNTHKFCIKTHHNSFAYLLRGKFSNLILNLWMSLWSFYHPNNLVLCESIIFTWNEVSMLTHTNTHTHTHSNTQTHDLAPSLSLYL